MKKTILAIICVALILGVFVFRKEKQQDDTKNIVATSSLTISSTVESTSETLAIQPLHTKSNLLQPVSVINEKNMEQVRVPEEMHDVTSDPAVVEMIKDQIANNIPKAKIDMVDIGEVKTNENGMQELWVNGSLLIQAKKIGPRTKSDVGIIVVETTTENIVSDREMSEPSEEKSNATPREIWMISPEGKRKISPLDVDASTPVISPDGSKIAFTGRLVESNGVISEEKLYVGNITNTRYRVFEMDHHNSSHDQIWPIGWEKNGAILKVLQDNSEFGGHLTLFKVEFERD